MSRYIPPATLAQALNELLVDELKQLARILPPPHPTRKMELIAALCAAARDHLEELWETLGTDQQTAIAEALHTPFAGEFDWDVIRAKYGHADKTIKRGAFLLFAPDARYIPRELHDRLRAFVPIPAADVPAYTDESAMDLPEDAIIFLGEQTALPELHMMLRLVHMGKISVSAKTGRPTAATQRTIGELLIGGDFYPPDWTPGKYTAPIGYIRAFSWPILLQATGLAQPNGNKLALTAMGQKALKHSTPNVIKAMFPRWLDHNIIDEFSRIDTIKGQASAKGRHMTPPASRRRVVKPALQTVTPGKWLTPTEWGRHMRATDNGFSITTSPWQLYIADAQYGSLYDGPYIWRFVNQRYLLALLMESLATMGLVDIAYVMPDATSKDYFDLWGTDDLHYLSRYDGLLYFRLSGLGAYVLGHTAVYKPTSSLPKTHLVSKGNGVLADVDNTMLPGDRLYLEQFAMPNKSNTAWHITMDTVTKAMEAGLDVAAMRSFLKNVVGSVPEDIDFVLSDLESGANRIASLGRGVVLQTRDAALAERLASDPILAKSVLQASGNYIIVLPGKQTAVRRRLKQMGFVLPVDVW